MERNAPHSFLSNKLITLPSFILPFGVCPVLKENPNTICHPTPQRSAPYCVENSVLRMIWNNSILAFMNNHSDKLYLQLFVINLVIIKNIQFTIKNNYVTLLVMFSRT